MTYLTKLALAWLAGALAAVSILGIAASIWLVQPLQECALDASDAGMKADYGPFGTIKRDSVRK